MALPTDIEKQSLEAHVELCAIRYNNLDSKLDHLEIRMEKLEQLMLDIKNSVSTSGTDSNKQTIGIFTTIIGALIAGMIGFISNGIFKK